MLLACAHDLDEIVMMSQLRARSQRVQHAGIKHNSMQQHSDNGDKKSSYCSSLAMLLRIRKARLYVRMWSGRGSRYRLRLAPGPVSAGSEPVRPCTPMGIPVPPLPAAA